MTAGLPLAGVRILELASDVGCYGTRLLADLGADVIAVEPPQGHDMRRDDLAFSYLFANKRGVTLDVTRPAAGGLLAELGGLADVVVLSPSAGDPPRPEWAAPGAVVCAVTPFGLTGPYRGWRATHLTSFALSGGMHPQGPPEGPPLVIPGGQKYAEVGAHVALWVLAALRKGGPQFVDLSAHEVLTATDSAVQRYVAGATNTMREAGQTTPPSGIWECADGPIEFQVWTDRHWYGFLELFARPAELLDEALALPGTRLERAATVGAVTARLVRDASRHDLVRRGQALGVPCGLLNTIGQFADDEQLASRDFLVGGRPGAPFRATTRLLELDRRPAPTVGQHNRDVYVHELSHSEVELDRWREAGLV